MFFFFFKQKTAYEMLRSLVGSEMCIRDRHWSDPIVPRLAHISPEPSEHLDRLGVPLACCNKYRGGLIVLSLAHVGSQPGKHHDRLGVPMLGCNIHWSGPIVLSLVYVGPHPCLLYTSDAADEEDSVDLGGRRIIKKKNKKLSEW
eukprot:TRINITY_DN12398_c0_g1_i6.p1 TRINITY_DN12398_c0_g1~~TRINITY_DN12398_c0_g1_i6.p1  ORF type:complete len:145 (-),score=38.46 TRINITY_DN12398_c0_g1_i6:74-508(-)